MCQFSKWGPHTSSSITWEQKCRSQALPGPVIYSTVHVGWGVGLALPHPGCAPWGPPRARGQSARAGQLWASTQGREVLLLPGGEVRLRPGQQVPPSPSRTRQTREGDATEGRLRDTWGGKNSGRVMQLLCPEKAEVLQRFPEVPKVSPMPDAGVWGQEKGEMDFLKALASDLPNCPRAQRGQVRRGSLCPPPSGKICN